MKKILSYQTSKNKCGCDWTPNEQITQNIVILYGLEQGTGLQYQICFKSTIDSDM